MASDLISRDALLKDFEIWYKEVGHETPRDRLIQNIITYAMDAVNDAEAVDAIEVVRCKDCVYWRDRHVLTPDGQRKSYSEMPPEAFNNSGLVTDSVTSTYGINCGSRCEIDCNSGYGVDKSVFREAGDFCSRGVKKDAVD